MVEGRRRGVGGFWEAFLASQGAARHSRAGVFSPGWPQRCAASPARREHAGPGRPEASRSRFDGRPPALRGISLVVREHNRDEIPAGDRNKPRARTMQIATGRPGSSAERHLAPRGVAATRAIEDRGLLSSEKGPELARVVQRETHSSRAKRHRPSAGGGVGRHGEISDELWTELIAMLCIARPLRPGAERLGGWAQGRTFSVRAFSPEWPGWRPIPGGNATENRAHRAFCWPVGRESRS